MKKFTTHTCFRPLSYTEDNGFKAIEDANGKSKIFTTRKAVENYCLKNKCIYVEEKMIFYR